MRILADENIDRPIVHWLREQGHDVIEVATAAPGASDPDLIRMSLDDDRILMTFDRDIGRIVLSRSEAHPGVIYLRLRASGEQLWEHFKQLWPKIEAEVGGHFVTVRNQQIRRRRIEKGTAP